MAGLSVAVVVFGASVLPAHADQIGTARSQLAALEQETTASAAHIRALTLAYEQDNTRASVLTSEVEADRTRLAQLQGQVATSRNALRQDAILGYTGGDTTDPVLGQGVADPAIRAEYIEMAAGNLAEDADQYRTEELGIASAEAGLTEALHQSQAATAATAAARSQAESEAASVQSQLQQVQATLTQLVTQQQAQRAAAAAAAQAETAAAYRQQAATQGLPVNDGLVNVVRSVVDPSPAPAASGGGGAGGVWLQLRQCESGDNYRENSGNGFFGAYQFSASTWSDLGYPGRPDLEPPAMQDAAAQKLQAEAGWGQWPACAAALGLT